MTDALIPDPAAAVHGAAGAATSTQPAASAPPAPSVFDELSAFIRAEVMKALGAAPQAMAPSVAGVAPDPQPTTIVGIVEEDLKVIAEDLIARAADMVVPSLPGMGGLKLFVTDVTGLLGKIVAKL